jgi:hypothetical protein
MNSVGLLPMLHSVTPQAYLTTPSTGPPEEKLDDELRSPTITSGPAYPTPHNPSSAAAPTKRHPLAIRAIS